MFIAFHAIQWIRFQRQRRTLGCVMVDIDDTLIDGNSVVNGFQFMKDLYQEIQTMFPVHVVTARPDEDHARVMKLKLSRGFCIPPDHLQGSHRALRQGLLVHWRSSMNTFLKIARAQRCGRAFRRQNVGRRAQTESDRVPRTQDKDCCVFLDPRQKDRIVQTTGPGVKIDTHFFTVQ